MMGGADELIPRSYMADFVHGGEKFRNYQGQIWQTVTHDVNFAHNHSHRYVSLGASIGREIILMDSHSRKVVDLKQRLLTACQGLREVGQILQVVNNLINELTAQPGKTRREVEKELDAKLEIFINKLYTSDITMDKLIDEKVLVCRHKGLLAAALIGFLIEQKVLPAGKAHQYRSTLKHAKKKEDHGAHSWAMYRDDTTGDLWLCDPRWNNVVNTSTTPLTHAALEGYGDTTLQAMIQRLNIADALRPVIDSFATLPQFTSIQNILIHPGTVSTPGLQLRIELSYDEIANKALIYALQQQGLRFEVKSHPNPFLVILPTQNPKLYSLNFAVIQQKYAEKIRENKIHPAQQASEAEVKQVPDAKVPTTSANDVTAAELQAIFKEVFKTPFVIKGKEKPRLAP